MFTEISMKHFRGFSEIALRDLSLVNLLTGKNSVGKTAFLEGIFLHLGATNPETALRINSWRELNPVPPDASETWGWLFNEKAIDLPIIIRSIDQDGIQRILSIKLEHALSERIVKNTKKGEDGNETDRRVASTTGHVPRVLQFKFSEKHRPSIESSGITGQDAIEIRPSTEHPFPLSMFISTQVSASKEDVVRFSAIEEVGREHEVVEILKTIEPRLLRLSTAMRGDVPIIRADLGTGRLLPIGLLGQGFVRLTKIVLCILSARDAFVLIDEIDNGLHHSALKSIWVALSEAARRFNVQIFATTHSRECVENAHIAFSESLRYDLAVYRLEIGSGGIRVVRYGQDTMQTALEHDLEVR